MDKPKIFIVDDEEEVRITLKRFLSRKLECDIQEASDGRKALDILKKEIFDIILLDVKMPGISGIDVLKKTRVTHPDTDILVITAYDSKQVAGEVFKGGAVEYFTKPLTVEAIHTKIIEILKRKNKYLPKIPKTNSS